MFLRPKESLRLSIYSIRRCIRISTSKDFHLTHCRNLRKISPGRRKVSNVVDYESSPSLAGEFPVSVAPKNVNENFFGIESDEGVIQINSKPSLNNNATRQFLNNVEQEKLITTTFGTVRYDSQNIPKHHGQLEKENVKVNSIQEKHKIRNLSQTLQSKISVGSDSLASEVKKNAMKITDMSNGNAESSSSNYVDELYFPEVYIEKEKNDNSQLETAPTTFNDDKVNLIEESYFNDKKTTKTSFKITDMASENSSTDNLSFMVHEMPTELIGNNKSSTFQPTSGLESVIPTSIENESNFIEDSFFRHKLPNEPVKNFNVTSTNIDNTDKNNHFLAQEKSTECITENKQSNIFDEYHFNTISARNLKTIDKKNLDYDAKIVDTTKKKSSNQESSTFNTIKLSSVQEVEANIKPLHNVNGSINEEINTVDNDEQLTLQLNNPSLEELEGYNKFLPDATNLSKKKNSFLFQSKKFLKESELINSNNSRVKKLISAQKNSGETDSAEKNQNKENGIKSQQKTPNVNVKNPNTNEQPESAYDFVKKLRSTKKKSDPELINGKFIQKTEQYDSKGFRILKNQVPDLKYYTKDEILDLLTKNILYSDDDLIVLNKPYNLVMHESKTVKDACLSEYLDDLAAELDKKTHKPKLITVHRLDKETCGCLLLARNEISAQRLLSLFAQRKIVKTYWIVTTRVPEPEEGIIDMPISEGSIDGRSRMVLHPNLPKDIPYQNHSKSGKRAVTHYKVIAESGNAALVEARPETGIKHQIRVHFGFGLSCPILGDHKYSHLDKLVPQKLQADLLQRLHVRQSKVRHIPMHIYARSILIPQYSEGRNLFVMAPMPIHMSKNLQKLKFRKN